MGTGIPLETAAKKKDGRKETWGHCRDFCNEGIQLTIANGDEKRTVRIPLQE